MERKEDEKICGGKFRVKGDVLYGIVEGSVALPIEIIYGRIMTCHVLGSSVGAAVCRNAEWYKNEDRPRKKLIIRRR